MHFSYCANHPSFVAKKLLLLINNVISVKVIFLLLLLNLTCAMLVRSQNSIPDDKKRKQIHNLIDAYSQARERRDTILLKSILIADVDQLVSTGEWRNGIAASVKGMLQSSTNSPGTRTLNIEKIRLLNPNGAIVDCKYDIQNADGTTRKMWSTFIVVSEKGIWKISAIRNMLPTGQ
jgi:hypothetical protein